MFIGIAIYIGMMPNGASAIFPPYAARVNADGGITESGTCVNAVSGLLLNASLLLIPSGFKEDVVYSEIPTNGNGDLTFTRASDASRTNALGLIQRVPWNLLQQSETFNNAIWNKTNTTIVANAQTAPNGTTTADTMTVTDSTTNLFQAVSYGSGEYTFSVYVKIISQTTAGVMRLQGNVDGANVSIIFTPTTEWQRFNATYSPITSITSVRIRGQAFVGTLAIWGAQFVEGTTEQTYLPTTDRLNVPRLDYSQGSCPALLLEPQRTNLALRSEEFNVSAIWTNQIAGTGVIPSITTNAVISPDGTQNAETVVFDRGAGNLLSDQSTLQQLLTIPTTGAYIFSIYAKASSAGDVGKQIFLRLGNAAPLFAITLTANWVRYFRAQSSVSSGAEPIQIGNRGTITANNTVSVDLYGAQVEAGAYATTYIATTTATVTRIVDSFTRNNIFTNGLITSSGGTWFLEFRNNVAYTRDNVNGIFIGDSTSPNTGNQFIIRGTIGGRLTIIKYISSVQTSIFTTSTDIIKIAIKWNGTTADVFQNGTKVVSATAFTTTNMENLVGSTGVPMFIQQMALYPSALSDSNCIALTTL